MDLKCIGFAAFKMFVDSNGNTQTRTVNTLQVAHLIAPDFMTNTNTNINHTASLNTNIQLDYVGDTLEASARFIYAKAQKQFRTVGLQQGQSGGQGAAV